MTKKKTFRDSLSPQQRRQFDDLDRKSVTINFGQDVLAALERARVRLQKTVPPGITVTMSDTIRALVHSKCREQESARDEEKDLS